MKKVSKQLPAQTFTNMVFGDFSSSTRIKIGNFYFSYQRYQCDFNSILLSATMRKDLNLILDSNVEIEDVYNEPKFLESVTFKYNKLGNKESEISIEHVREKLYSIPINLNMTYNFSEESKYQLICIEKEESGLCLIDENTNIIIVNNSGNLIFGENSEGTKTLFKGNFNFNDMDIGGLDDEFIKIFRRAFSTRLLSKKTRENLNIKEIRGIMLYGPPGCGKTLIARKLSQIINAKDVKIVSGPSLIHGLIGKTEENVRDLFLDAESDPDNLYVIILDECDVIFKKRGSGSGVSGEVTDNMVNQFLSKIDGVNSLRNILLIGMTNRIETIDPAILRPGRIELHLEIKLPNEKARGDILNIHLRKIKSLETIDSNKLIELTVNFTGAEIEGAIENAKTFSVARVIDPDNLKNDYSEENIFVTQNDLERAINETTPAYGTKSNILSIILSKDFKPDDDYDQMLDFLRETPFGKVNSLMICRENRTMIACNLAKETECGCIKFVNAESLINSRSKSEAIYEIIEDCCKSFTSTIIFDSVELIVEYSKFNNYCNNSILQILYILLEKQLSYDKRINVIFTSSKPELMDRLEFLDLVSMYSGVVL